MKSILISTLRWSQKYTKTDMVYIAQGSFWLLTGKVGLILISLVSMMAFARFLPAENFGVYKYILSLSAMASIFALPGIKTTLVRSIAKGQDGTLGLAIREKMKFSLIGSLGLLIGAGWYAFNGNLLLAGGLFLSAIFLPANSVWPIFDVFWLGKKRFDIQSIYKFLAAFVVLLAIIPTVYFTNSVLIIIFTLFTAQAISEGFFLLKTWRARSNDEKDYEAISFGKKLTAVKFLGKIAANIDSVIIWQFLGPVQVAIYSFALLPISKIKDALLIQKLALPKLSEKTLTKNLKKGIVSKLIRLFILSFSVAGILALIAPFVYQILFPQYAESIIYFQALLILIALTPLQLLSATYLSQNKQKEIYILSIVEPVLKIILFLILVPTLGLWGIVIAIIVARILTALTNLYLFYRLPTVNQI